MTDLHDQQTRLGQTHCRAHAFPGRGAVGAGADSHVDRTRLSAERELDMGVSAQAARPPFTSDEARAIATELGIDFGQLGCDLEQFRMGLDVELEHGSREPGTDVSGNDSIVTGKIALAHLTEFPDYYTRLAILEREAAAHKTKRT
jgi:hypothetical protein